ncbi:TIGR00730 family Rossman fold protein [Paenibacillus camelliae]|uniref:LOG family protein n=1 Tax=Paenibacillus camelliae TaxID=512410 RepID=UPI00203CE364|nr:TIGR00730 family Rossman fold protein [Paenibacillus camelliae]MCM3632348.1 TIGR00730 family Rossman fold protein [Paenibacillus camelliae]
MKRIAVYCGSSIGASSDYEQAAIALGNELAQRGIGLVYGGSRTGLMGAVADAVLQAGGEVIGIIPHHLAHREIAHEQLTKLIKVDSMHERKHQMMDLSDGFIAMPGGAGTMEEYFEVITWSQIGLHKKPCGLLNVKGYYNPLIHLFDHMVQEQFLKGRYAALNLVAEQPHELLEQMANFRHPDEL